MNMKAKKLKKESRIGLLVLFKEASKYTCVIVVTRGLMSLDGIIVAEGDENQLVSRIISEKLFKQVSFIVPLTKDSEQLARLLSSNAGVSIINERELIDNPSKELLYKGYVKLTFQFMEKLISLRRNRCKIN